MFPEFLEPLSLRGHSWHLNGLADLVQMAGGASRQARCQPSHKPHVVLRRAISVSEFQVWTAHHAKIWQAHVWLNTFRTIDVRGKGFLCFQPTLRHTQLGLHIGRLSGPDQISSCLIRVFASADS